MLAFLHALLKVNEDLKTIGALAGFAAIPGLAVLSLLYFGQAREVRRLREWAGRAPERATELEQRVTADAARRVQAQPAPRPATQAATPAGQASTGNGVAQAKPAEPATVAAQAAAAPAEAKPDAPGSGEAAEAKPAEEKEGGEETRPDEGAPAEGAKAPAADAAAPAADKPASPEASPAKPAAPAAPAADSGAGSLSAPAPKAEPAAPGAPPPSPEPAAIAASTAAGAAAARPGSDRPRSPAPPVPPRPAQPLRAPSPSATIPPRPAPAAPRPDDEGGGRFAGRRGIVAAGLAVAVLAIGAAVIARVVAGGSEEKAPPAPNTLGQAPASTPQPSGPGAPAARTKAQRAQTSVAVLNGTTVTGLARSVANRLEEQGFATVTVTDASNQAQSDTKVEFTAGHRAEAFDAARSLRVPASQVVAASDVDTTTAGPSAEVVVVVGQNFAR